MIDETKAQDGRTPEPVDGKVSQPRREALEKLGRYGLYTAPALLLLFKSEKAAAVS